MTSLMFMPHSKPGFKDDMDNIWCSEDSKASKSRVQSSRNSEIASLREVAPIIML